MARPRKTPPTDTPPVPEQAPRPQMADIARLAGVSVSAVSLALRGSPMISEQTRQRIVELARSLNYQVNMRARNLRTKSNRTVAVVVPHSTSDLHHLSDPFYLGLIGSIADALINRGYQMLLARVDEDGGDLAALYETGQAIGVVLTGASRPHDQCNRLALAGVPLVVWGAPVLQQLYCTIGSDNQQGARLATLHLLAQGARQVAFIGDNLLPEGALRYLGYREALQAHGLDAEPGLHRVPPHSTPHTELVASLLDARPGLDAVFASGDVIAMTVIQALRKLGKRVPEDVAVIGFDDIELAAFFQPALTTVRQPIPAIGMAIVEALAAQLDKQQPATLQLPAELIVRESTRRAET